MTILSQILAAVALLASAVIYGTDVFCAIVQRPALAQVSDGALTSVMGRVHEYGDRRLPLPGVIGLIAAALAAITAGITGHGRGGRCSRRGGPPGRVARHLPAHQRPGQPRPHLGRPGRARPG